MKINKNFLVVLLITTPLFIFSQKNSGYGIVKTDGFDKITFGAFWSKRPEAKKVFYWNEGESLPEGVDEIKILQDVTFARFFGNEHNSRDINYIAVPAGEKIFRMGSQWFLSNCGNRIEFWNPVYSELPQKVDEKDTYVKPKEEKSIMFEDNNKSSSPMISFEEGSTVPENNYNPEESITGWQSLKPWKKTLIIAGSAALLAGGTYLIVDNWPVKTADVSVIENGDSQDGQPVGGKKKAPVIPIIPSYPTKYQIGIGISLFK